MGQAKLRGTYEERKTKAQSFAQAVHDEIERRKAARPELAPRKAIVGRPQVLQSAAVMAAMALMATGRRGRRG